ncbi:MAG: AAA family ATPase [Desulfobacula sp.]|uniref:AAA family ATPase n=1 Tax=Desulfobacula sp. TaxID=2593537 RepID=UPI0025BAE5C9|nr:AAA family ATPase [Desulfobacula sp.]MCD4720915.1 AAA family ATPase [Desulfobacula sp.]
MNIKSEVGEWFHTRPNWQQEAADRILKKGSLSSIDIDELTDLAKTDKGQEKTDFHKFNGLGTSASGSADLQLKAISEIEGIDNLSPRKPHTLGKNNITVVYGNNGSGKSGYTRILKKVCGKSHAVELKSNVFGAPPDKQCCKIEYEFAGKTIDVTWSAKDDPVNDLCNIDIFDTTSGELYLVKENEAAYTPAVLGLFDKLIQACDSVRDCFKSALLKLPSKLPVMPREYGQTKAEKLYSSLRASQTESSLANILVWTKEDDLSLKSLDERLKAKDPKKQAEQKRNRKKQIDLLHTQLTDVINNLAANACAEIFKLKNSAKEKRDIAIGGAKAVQDMSSLSGVGSETWRALWYAAREYSKKEAYKDNEFPNTSDDARCILCHQKLDTNARKRFQKFEKYITGKLSSDAATAELKYSKKIEVLPDTPKSEIIQTTIQAAGLESEEWLPKLTTFWKNVEDVIERIKKQSEYSKFGIDKKKLSWLEELKELADSLENQAKQLDKDAKAFDREKALADKRELSAKKWTSDQKNAIKDELKRLKQITQINKWIRTTSTAQISKQAGVLAQQVLTDAYVSRFNLELQRLGARRIKVEIVKTRAKKGHVLHRLCLKGLNYKTYPPGDILSDGEKRIVTLAAFLADVTGNEEKAPFIFDDPISSLDQDFEEKSIDRLIELSKDRQVQSS